MHTMRSMLDVERAATGTGQRVDVSYCCSVTILALAATIPRPDQLQTPSRGASVWRLFDENKPELYKMRRKMQKYLPNSKQN